MALTTNEFRVLANVAVQTRTLANAQANLTAATQVDLTFTAKEIRTANPPSNDILGRTIASISIEGRRYTDRISWSRAWFEQYQNNIRKGRRVLGVQFPVESISADNIVTAANTLLSWELAQAGLTSVETAQEPRATAVTTEIQRELDPGQRIETLRVDSVTGNLIYRWTDGREQVAGYVAGPAAEISIGTVLTRPNGTGSSVSIEGTGPAYVLNFELETGPYQEGAVLETGSYTDPQWLTITTLGTLTLTEEATEPQQAVTKAYVDRLDRINRALTIVFGS